MDKGKNRLEFPLGYYNYICVCYKHNDDDDDDHEMCIIIITTTI